MPYSAKRLCWMFNYSVSRKLEKLTTDAISKIQQAQIEPYTRFALLDDILAARMETLAQLSITTAELYRSDVKYSYREAFPVLCQKLKQFIYPNYSRILQRYSVACTVNKCPPPT